MNKLLIVIEGGNIREVLSNTTIEISIVDYDLKKKGEPFVFQTLSEKVDTQEVEKEISNLTNK